MIGRSPVTSPLVEEYRIFHTPVIGAYLFWRFAKAYVAYTSKAGNSRYPHFLMFCFVAAFISDRRLLEEVGIKKSIITYRRHLIMKKKGVYFDGIHERVKRMLPYTMAALDICYSCGILKLLADDATIAPVGVEDEENISEETRKDSKIVERLSKWFAECKDVNEVARRLEVVL